MTSWYDGEIAWRFRLGVGHMPGLNRSLGRCASEKSPRLRVGLTMNRWLALESSNADVDRPERSGYIGLQMWDTVADFRNVRVHDLAR
jgi:hypothetical protein